MTNDSDQSTKLWDDARLAAPHDQPDKSARVRRMFDAIAPTYELVNTMFSAGRDRSWRHRCVTLAGTTTDDRVLDIACGTGDLTRAFAGSHLRPAEVVGCDFSAAMLARASHRNGEAIRWVQADGLALPFASGSFTITGCAFGVRNFQNLDAGLGEMFRVLAPGGRAVILEFSRPKDRWARRVYEWYADTIMPLGATLVSGDRTGAYRYLPRSVVSFSESSMLCSRLRNAGFEQVHTTTLTFGVVTVYVAVKSRDA